MTPGTAAEPRAARNARAILLMSISVAMLALVDGIAKPRTVMSSIIRWRSRLVAVLVMINSCL